MLSSCTGTQFTVQHSQQSRRRQIITNSCFIIHFILRIKLTVCGKIPLPYGVVREHGKWDFRCNAIAHNFESRRKHVVIVIVGNSICNFSIESGNMKIHLNNLCGLANWHNIQLIHQFDHRIASIHFQQRKKNSKSHAPSPASFTRASTVCRFFQLCAEPLAVYLDVNVLTQARDWNSTEETHEQTKIQCTFGYGVCALWPCCVLTTDISAKYPFTFQPQQ